MQISIANILTLVKQKGLFISGHVQESSLSKELVAAVSHSQKVDEAHAFIAIKGVHFDGHSKISELLAAHCPLVILDNPHYISCCGDQPWILVKNSRAVWALLSANSLGNPQNTLQFIGITGTNGKTSTAFLLWNLLKLHGIESGLLGTLGNFIGSSFYPSTHTTPDPDQLYPMLGNLVDQGIKLAIMEVSSHALDQERLWGLHFSGVAFTSFSQDHLDYHKSMSEYWDAKSLLFKNHISGETRVILNNALTQSPLPEGFNSSDVWIYGLADSQNALDLAGIKNVKIERSIDFPSAHFRCQLPSGPLLQGTIPFFSDFLVENLLAAVLLFEKITGFFPDQSSYQKLKQIPGRMELVSTSGANAKLPKTFVDFAHSPDALAKALIQLKAFCSGKLWVVFGCGGDRDRLKRPLMAAAAERYADNVIVTSDNPRNENAGDIILDIVRGFKTLTPQVVEDRRVAIELALKHAHESDIVLIAGKGHETYQIIGKQKNHFSDLEVAQEFFQKRLQATDTITEL